MRQEDLQRVLYFAYGHNTQTETIQARCPSAKLMDTGVLHNFQLTFHQYSNIENQDGTHVEGVVWSISRSDLERLDGQEALHEHYNRIPVEVMIKGVPYKCTAYIMDPGFHPDATPSRAYLQDVRKGYQEHGLPLSQIEEALDRS